MLRIVNSAVTRLLVPVLGYPFAALFVLAGVVLTADSLTPALERSELSAIDGKVLSADRIIRKRAPVRPYDTYQQKDTYSIRFVVEQNARQETFLVPEPRLHQVDIANLRGARVTALFDGMSEVWELKTSERTFFTYDDTLAVQIAGKRQAVSYGPLLLAAGALMVWQIVRNRRA